MTALPIFAKEQPVVFSTLQEAVSFLTKALDVNDSQPVRKACINKRKKWNESYWNSLRLIHEKTPLNKLYAERIFPENESKFTLGGHGSDLGHIWIDFVKKGKWWYLDSIWVCR